MFRLSFRYLFYSVVVVLGCATTGCAIPAWYTDAESVDVPSGGPAYFYGRGAADIEEGKKADALAKAKQSAIHDACSMVCCKVNGQTERYQEETDAALVDAFISRTTIDTAVEAARVKVLEQDTDRHRAYVLVGIPRDDLRNAYRERIRKGLADAKDDFTLAEELVEENPRQSLSKYLACMTTLRSLDDDLKVYLILNGWKNDLGDPQTVVPRKMVERRLGELADVIPKRTDELAAELAGELLKGRDKGSSFAIYPIEYENTGFVSDFGNRLTELLAASLVRRGGWRRVKGLNEADCIVRGKLLVAGKGMNIVLTCRGQESEHVAQLYVSPQTCAKLGWKDIKPLDLDTALQNWLALNNELKSDMRLRVELQTNKLADGPVVYRYGEHPKLALKASRACYVRLIYVFSDGTKVLLLDNYRIANDMANEWQRLPVNWEVCEPPGVEQMLVQATIGEKMPPLNVRRKNLPGGFYQDIIAGGLEAAVVRTRGAKQYTEKSALTELPYQWTIFER